MAKNQKAKASRVRRRTANRTETRADALMRAGAPARRWEAVARKSTGSHGEVRVEMSPDGGVRVVSRDQSLTMADEESAMTWLDNL